MYPGDYNPLVKEKTTYRVSTARPHNLLWLKQHPASDHRRRRKHFGNPHLVGAQCGAQHERIGRRGAAHVVASVATPEPDEDVDQYGLLTFSLGPKASVQVGGARPSHPVVNPREHCPHDST